MYGYIWGFMFMYIDVCMYGFVGGIPGLEVAAYMPPSILPHHHWSPPSYIPLTSCQGTAISQPP